MGKFTLPDPGEIKQNSVIRVLTILIKTLDHLLHGKLDHENLLDKGITDRKIKNVNGSKIDDLSIDGQDKLKDASVNNAKIINLDGAKIFDNTVTNNEIANGTVTNNELANDTIKTGKIKDKAICWDKLDTYRVTGSFSFYLDAGEEQYIVVDHSATKTFTVGLPPMFKPYGYSDYSFYTGRVVYAAFGNKVSLEGIYYTNEYFTLILKNNDIISRSGTFQYYRDGFLNVGV